MRTLMLLTTATVGLLGGGDRTAVAGTGEPKTVDVHVIRLADPDRAFAFEPADLVIRPGTAIRWVNDADVYHTVTTSDSPARLAPNGLIDGRLARAGVVVEFTFDQPGEYTYYCRPHSDLMVGVVRVIVAAESSSLSE